VEIDMRIAHITDLHLRHHLPGWAPGNARRSREAADLLSAALREARTGGADLVALTGDLLNCPRWLRWPIPGFTLDPAEPWRQATLRDYQLIRRLLDDSGLPYLVTPGECDDPEAMAQVFPLDEHVHDVSGFRVVRFCDCWFEGRVPRRFIPARALWRQMLADAQSPPQIHLQHYPMTPTPGDEPGDRYAEADSMLAAMDDAAATVRLCLGGHRDAGSDLVQRGRTSYSTAPALCVWPHRWRMVELTDAGVTCSDHALAGAPQRRRVVFLDRDGVINDLAAFNAGPERMALLPRTAGAIARLRQAGLVIVVISAQGGVGVGNLPPSIVDATNDVMHRLLAQAGTQVDSVYYSVGAGDHAVLPEFTDLRDAKPNPTLLLRAAEELHLDLATAWMVGDRVTDVQTAHHAGVQPVLVRTGQGAVAQTQLAEKGLSAAVVDDLADAADVILSRTSLART
jgi:histidinol-phosphate phosphatase family protein